MLLWVTSQDEKIKNNLWFFSGTHGDIWKFILIMSGEITDPGNEGIRARSDPSLSFSF